MRPASPKCPACGPEKSIAVDTYDYDEFCSGVTNDTIAESLGINAQVERLGVAVCMALPPRRLNERLLILLGTARSP
jgi:hypothetical protein